MSIGDLNILTGRLPARVRGLVEERAGRHQAELDHMWNTKQFQAIDPLV